LRKDLKGELRSKNGTAFLVPFSTPIWSFTFNCSGLTLIFGSSCQDIRPNLLLITLSLICIFFDETLREKYDGSNYVPVVGKEISEWAAGARKLIWFWCTMENGRRRCPALISFLKNLILEPAD
jgi:hypothetical protein